MSFQTAPLALFAVFASLSMNLILQCGLGARGITISQGAGKPPPWVKLGVLLVTVVLLWLVFAYVIFSLPLGLFAYVLIFPLSSLVYFGLEYLTCRFGLQKSADVDGPVNFHDGLAAAALFMTLHIAGGLVEALTLAFGFTVGILLAFVILGEIRRRSTLEGAPNSLRGTPLALISMGLLSLIFSSAALLFFRAIGG